MTELTAILKEETNETEINEIMKKSTEGNESFNYDDREIVSSEIIGTTYGSVFGPTQTEVTSSNGHQLFKVVAWYDNEYGFACQMICTLEKVASL